MMAPKPITEVCVIGMGYVGLTLSVALAEAGYRVCGIENNHETLASLRAGATHLHEPGFADKYAANLAAGTIQLRESLDASIAATAFIITVGTPIFDDKKVNLLAIQQVVDDLTEILKPNDLVVLRSTIKIGTTRQIVKHALDKANVPYHLAMCPERTVEGRALEELKNLPQIVGGLDAGASSRASELFSRVASEIVTVSSPEVAELAKLVNNTQRDLYFAYANEVALMADALGLDAREVIHAANHNYPRSRIAKPGLVGGPCMEKDTFILSESMAAVEFVPHLALAGRRINEELIDLGIARVAEVVKAQDRRRIDISKVAVLGLAFKGSPAVGDIRGSLAIPLMIALEQTFPEADVRGYDAVASVAESARWGLYALPTLEEVLQDADVLIIQNNHADFCGDALKPHLARLAPKAILYDFWECVSVDLVQGTDITHLGLGYRNHDVL